MNNSKNLLIKKITLPAFLIFSTLQISCGLIFFYIYDSNISKISEKQFNSTLLIFQKSIQDSFLRGLDYEVKTDCDQIAKEDFVFSVEVKRATGEVLCYNNRKNKGRTVTLASNILFSNNGKIAGRVQITFMHNYFNVIVRYFATVMIISILIAILLFFLFGTWVSSFHLSPITDLAGKLEKGDITSLINESNNNNSGRNFEIQSLSSGIENLAKKWTAAQEELIDKEKISAINEYSQLIAHDIKAPLMGIQAGLKSLRNSPDKAEKLLNMSAVRIENMIEKIMNNQKSNDLDNKLQKVNISDWFKKNENFNFIYSEKIKIIFINKLVDEGVSVMISPDRLERSIQNIIKNSVEAMNSTSGEIKVSLSRTSSAIKILIIDNGPGIPENLLPGITQKGKTYYKEKGSGLGLYQTKSAIESMNGKLNISNNSPQGLIVSILLPL